MSRIPITALNRACCAAALFNDQWATPLFLVSWLTFAKLFQCFSILSVSGTECCEMADWERPDPAPHTLGHLSQRYSLKWFSSLWHSFQLSLFFHYNRTFWRVNGCRVPALLNIRFCFVFPVSIAYPTSFNFHLTNFLHIDYFCFQIPFLNNYARCLSC
jgi:hypothetical protein